MALLVSIGTGVVGVVDLCLKLGDGLHTSGDGVSGGRGQCSDIE